MTDAEKEAARSNPDHGGYGDVFEVLEQAQMVLRGLVAQHPKSFKESEIGREAVNFSKWLDGFIEFGNACPDEEE